MNNVFDMLVTIIMLLCLFFLIMYLYRSIQKTIDAKIKKENDNCERQNAKLRKEIDDNEREHENQNKKLLDQIEELRSAISEYVITTSDETPFWLKDAQTKNILFVNEEFERQFLFPINLSCADIIGTRLETVFPNIREKIIEADAKLTRFRTATIAEIQFLPNENTFIVHKLFSKFNSRTVLKGMVYLINEESTIK